MSVDSRRAAIAACLCLTACASSGTTAARRSDAPLPAGVEAVSPLGDTLRTLPLPADVRTRYEQQLMAARAAYERTPRDADSAIWLGRRLGYLGRFRDAIDVYTRGIARHQTDARLYRHRGHRYISVRDFDRAIVDLEYASALVIGQRDVIEPDGQPNARNQPIGTLQSNIAYHLGLAYYLRGDFDRAAVVFRREIENANNPDRLVSATHWLYMSLRRLGRTSEAEEAIVPVQRDLQVVENGTYHRLIMMYKGVLPPDSLLTPNASGAMSVTDATAAYGVGNWHLYNGRRAEAEQIFRRIIAGGQWGSFGYIAAEADLARTRK